MSTFEKAATFMEAHARVIDRRRFDLVFGEGDAEAVVTALAGYANADGGFGWALEPDLRSAGSQPIAALQAFEVLEEIAPSASQLAAALCDWLESVSLADGGLPFALPGAPGAGSAPLWSGVDHGRSSLLMTSAVCGSAQRIARHDPAVRAHPWLARASAYCLSAISGLRPPPFAIELRFALQFLDALSDTGAAVAGELDRLGRLLPGSGELPVAGGAEGERMRPLDFSPTPGRPLRELLAPEVIGADLERLAAEQADDGGWDVDWRTYSPAAALEWRGWATVRALKTLQANSAVSAARG